LVKIAVDERLAIQTDCCTTELQETPTVWPLLHVNREQAWRQYVDEGRLDIELVPREVANSWQRCHQAHLDPFREPESPVNLVELRDRLYRKQNLVNLSRPFMENLYAFVRGSGFQVILTDELGVLLEVLGDKDVLEKTQRVQLCPGGDWSEATKGTNAIGTAIVERKPVQVYASEHYCQANHFLTCSACPVFDVDGSMIGVLDMSGDYHVANPHTLGMVVAAVNAIENQLRLQKATSQLYNAYRYSNILLENMSDGLISIDTQGIVTEINAKGAEIFGVDRRLVRGRHVSRIHNADTMILPILTNAMQHEHGEIVVENMGRSLSGSSAILRDDSGGVLGAVAVFREHMPQITGHAPLPHAHSYTFDDILGSSPAIVALKEWARMAAASPFTVLISGETGTGKELFAQAIHNASPRRDRPFIALNCAALPESLIESELFGYEDGSFTGARKGGRAGKFQIADGGTIFLDEIGDMSLGVQMKLLRVIQERKVSRIGSACDADVDVRIIAATHKDLRAEAERGDFRFDLYYRLNVLEIRIPPLRERAEDIPALILHLADKIALRFNRRPIPVSEAFLEKAKQHTWPGNIRELENAIERAVIRGGEERGLTADLLEFPSEARPQDKPVGNELSSLKETERILIEQALLACKGNIRQTARKLGIGRNTLYRKMKEHGISYREVRQAAAEKM
jgi:sigma-54 dependent transcriptional regulator, acetoin dehydrogenase operon transcriptional activator AcoR